ncbi:alpha/beta fold hydrolase [Bacillus thuringiensis]
MNTAINKQEYILLNGIEQFISVNGTDISKPLIIFLHGGPGAGYGTRAYTFEKWFEHFNVVFWDQPGAGRTAIKNPNTVPTFNFIINSLKELILYLKKEYSKKKIGILGRSWGTVPGIYYAKHFPEDILFYCGTGQIVNTQEDEHVAYTEMKKRLIETDNMDGLQKLSMLGEDYPGTDILNIRGKLDAFHQYLEDYGMFFEKPGITKKEELINSPIYIPEDLTIQKKVSANQDEIFKFLGQFNAYKYSLNYEIPFFQILGEEDWVVPIQQQIKFYDQVTAPKKDITVISDAGHKVMTDQPEKFLNALVKYVQSVINP